MSIAVPIIAIIVVWAFVLAPWLLRSQRPMSHTGEAFDDTRVLFEGDSGNVAARRRPRVNKRDVRRFEDDTEDYEVIDASDISVVDEEETPAVTIAGAAAKAKANPRQPGAQLSDEPEGGDAVKTDAPETVEGEIVEESGKAKAETTAKEATQPAPLSQFRRSRIKTKSRRTQRANPKKMSSSLKMKPKRISLWI